MKEIMKYFVLVAAAAMALASCETPEIEGPVDETREYSYVFTIGQDSTKAAIGENCVEWEENDRMGVYAKTAGGEISYNASGYITPGSPAILKVYSFKPLTSGDKVYTYYPYKSQTSQDPSSVTLSIPVKQTESDAMPMVSLPMTVSKDIAAVTDTEVSAGELKLVNLGSIIEFNIYSTTSEYTSEMIQSVRFEADQALAGSFDFDMTKVDYTNLSSLDISGYEETVVTYTPAEPIPVGADKANAAIVNLVVAPGSYSGKVIVTTDVAEYTFPISSPKEFARSVVKPLGLNLRADVRKEFKEVTFDFTDPLKYNISPSAESGGKVAVSEPIIVGDVTFTPDSEGGDVVIYTKEENIDNSATITYELRSYKGSMLKFAVAEGHVITAIQISGTNRDNLIPDSGIYDSGKWYGSARSVDFSLSAVAYLKTVTVSYETGNPKTAQTISFAEAQYSAVLGEDFLMPELTGANTDLTYSSSDEEVAAVDENGMITLLAEGTTVIKAVAQEDATYAPAQASYTLVVSVPVGPAETVQTIPWTEDFGGDAPLDKYEIVQGTNSTLTKIISGTYAGGTTPELLLNGGGGTLTAQIDASDGGQAYSGGLTLTFKSNNPSYLQVSSSTEGVTIEMESDTEYILTLDNVEVFDLTLTNIESSNARVDDISLTAGVPQDQTLSFSQSEYSFVLGQDVPADFIEPELSGAMTEVTYVSDNESVAIVDALSGQVTLGSADGVAVITATAAGTAQYRPASISYTITLESAEVSDEHYVKVTEVPADWSGVYLIAAKASTTNVDGLVVLSSMNETGKQSYATYKAVTEMSSGVIESTAETDMCAVVVQKLANGNYSIKLGDYWIGRTSTSTNNNTITASETFVASKYEWTFSVVDNVLYIKSVYESTHSLKWNNSSGSERFSSYSSTPNITLYRLEPLPSSGSGDTGTGGIDEPASVPQALTGKGWLELPGASGNQEYVQALYKDESEVSEDMTARNYTYNYDTDMFTSLWVAYPLYAASLSGSNEASWKYNPNIDESKQVNVIDSSYGVNLGSVDNTNYDSTLEYYARGHQLPDADRKASASKNSQTAYMTNLTPQIHNGFNNSVWKALEGAVRTVAEATDTVYVVTGAAFQKVGESEKDVTWITPQDDSKACPVPNYYWKVLLKVKRSGSTVTSASTVGFWYEHKSYSGTGAKFNDEEYVVSVDDIEAWTGFDFFVNLPDTIESATETDADWESFSGF